MNMRDRLGLAFESGQVQVPSGGSIVVWNATPRPFYQSLSPDRVLFVLGDWQRSLSLVREGFRTASTHSESCSLAIVEIGRSRKATLGQVGAAYCSLETGRTLVVDGHREMGIDGILRQLRKAHGIDGAISKFHGRVFWLTRKEKTPDIFQEWKALLDPARNRDGFFTTPTLFSSDGIDPGSACLAAALPDLRGHGADFGAGWGWLSLRALASNPDIASMTLIDCEADAIRCARLNVSDPRARFMWADVLTCEFEQKFDFVLMNPPFHRTNRPEPGLGHDFIRRAASALHPSGTLDLVANRFLAYERVVESSFRSWRVVGEANGFKAIRARNPKT